MGTEGGRERSRACDLNLLLSPTSYPAQLTNSVLPTYSTIEVRDLHKTVFISTDCTLKGIEWNMLTHIGTPTCMLSGHRRM